MASGPPSKEQAALPANTAPRISRPGIVCSQVPAPSLLYRWESRRAASQYREEKAGSRQSKCRSSLEDYHSTELQRSTTVLSKTVLSTTVPSYREHRARVAGIAVVVLAGLQSTREWAVPDLGYHKPGSQTEAR